MSDPTLHQVLVPMAERRPAPVPSAEERAEETRKRALRAHRKRLSGVLANPLHDRMMEAFAALIDRRPVEGADTLRAALLAAVRDVPFDVLVRQGTSPDELAASAEEVIRGQ